VAPGSPLPTLFPQCCFGLFSPFTHGHPLGVHYICSLPLNASSTPILFRPCSPQADVFPPTTNRVLFQPGTPQDARWALCALDHRLAVLRQVFVFCYAGFVLANQSPGPAFISYSLRSFFSHRSSYWRSGFDCFPRFLFWCTIGCGVLLDSSCFLLLIFPPPPPPPPFFSPPPFPRWDAVFSQRIRTKLLVRPHYLSCRPGDYTCWMPIRLLLQPPADGPCPFL